MGAHIYETKEEVFLFEQMFSVPNPVERGVEAESHLACTGLKTRL